MEADEVDAQQRFEIEVTTPAGASLAILTLAGEVDMSSAHEIDAVVAVVAGWNETADVVIDLSRVSFIDSSGIAALLRCRQELDDAGIGFNVIGAQGMPLNVLRITGVLPYLSKPATTANIQSA
jgi:anti-anti-sigma factor